MEDSAAGDIAPLALGVNQHAHANAASGSFNFGSKIDIRVELAQREAARELRRLRARFRSSAGERADGTGVALRRERDVFRRRHERHNRVADLTKAKLALAVSSGYSQGLFDGMQIARR